VSSLADWVGHGSVLARLVHDDNTPYLDAAGDEITSSRVVVFSAPASCDEPSGTGGAGATGGMASSGAGDASAEAGAGVGGASN
jgi:hypothetical protein